MDINKVPKSVFDSGLLNREFHERLIGDLEQLVETAGVPESAVFMRLSEFCTGGDFQWVKVMRGTPDAGMVYVGDHDPSVDDRMVAITGVCLRNYTDARVMTLQEVLKSLKTYMPEPTVLLIPNFCMRKDDGGDVPTWDTTPLLSMLISRANKRQRTILYVPSMDVLEKQYGASFRKHIEGKFSQCHSSGFYQSPLSAKEAA